MLTRVYIDNYKCFSNFEYKPAANELILGVNGTGKTSVFLTLRLIRSLVYDGTSVSEEEFVGPTTTTRWDERETQRFELEVTGNAGTYTYTLEIEYAKAKCRVGLEQLCFAEEGGSQGVLFKRYRDEGHLYRDDFSQGPQVLMDWNRSGLCTIQPRDDNTRLTWFKEWVGRILCLQIDPRQMVAESRTERTTPRPDLRDYASWYRHLVQEESLVTDRLRKQLAEVIDGFQTLVLRKVTEDVRVLDVVILSADGRRSSFALGEMSDGQRALIGLYTVAAMAHERASAGADPITICIDEPENFVALAELEPWIHEMEETADGQHVQLLVASHHPEFINRYAHTNATLFYREKGGPVRTKRFTAESDEGLLPSEIVARGWEGE